MQHLFGCVIGCKRRLKSAAGVMCVTWRVTWAWKAALPEPVRAGELAGVRVGNRLSLPVAQLNQWIDARRVGRRQP